MTYDVVIIGGGPAGCKAAELISAKGYQVLVVEEHPRVGEPMQCAGLVSPRTLKNAGLPDDIVMNKIYGAFVHSPGGEILALRSKKVHGLVIDRSAFDRQLANKAESQGAKIITGARAGIRAFAADSIEVHINKGGSKTTINSRLLIGADGACSRVAERIGVVGSVRHIRTFASEVELECQEKEMAHVFLGRDIAPGWFGWVIPVDGRRARVGLGTSDKDKHPREYFKKLVKDHPRLFNGMKVTRYTGGSIPIGSTSSIYGDRTLLLGDAACQTKQISGGGIYLGLTGARLCAEVAEYALSSGNCTAARLKEYQLLWNKEMGAEMQSALRHRDVFLGMSDSEMDNIIRFLNRPTWQRIITKYGDIDYPSKLAGKLSFAGPWAEKFMVAGFKKVLGYCT